MKIPKPYLYPRTRKPIKVGNPSLYIPPVADTPEQLTGEVQGRQAQAGEERLCGAISGHPNTQWFWFEMPLGAPEGLPGWIQLDVAWQTQNLLYAIEVDTPFTHRYKTEADHIHDTKVLQNLESYGEVWPQVIHVNAEEKLTTKQDAINFVRSIAG